MRPSFIDRLPPAIRAEIARLRAEGSAIDAILTHLHAIGRASPSRSALGRYIRKLDEISEPMRRSHTVAEALMRALDQVPESPTTRVNTERRRSIIVDMLLGAAEAAGIDDEENAALTGDPDRLALLAKALGHLGRANRHATEAIESARRESIERGKKAAAQAGEGKPVQRGLSAETIAAIKEAIFGVRPPLKP